MKRLFFCILFVFPFLAISQNIVEDKLTSDGHFITTSYLPIYTATNGKSGNISLGVAYNESMHTFFSLNLQMVNEEDLSIPQGASLQLLSNEGRTILLRNAIFVDDKQTQLNNNIITISYGLQYNEKELANLDEIMNERIIKIRVETKNGIIEKNIDDNNFSIAVHDCFETLRIHLESMKM